MALAARDSDRVELPMRRIVGNAVPGVLISIMCEPYHGEAWLSYRLHSTTAAGSNRPRDAFFGLTLREIKRRRILGSDNELRFSGESAARE